MITRAQIKKFCPSAKEPLVKAIVDNWGDAEAVGITTDLRIPHFMTQIAVETGGLTSVEESLNYSVEALMSKFSRVRISAADAKKYGRTARRKADQKAIANTVYGGAWGRKNLGNTQPNDGWDMRGGGMGQTTGRANYADLGFEDNPAALREPVTAFKTAVREWAKRNCNRYADADDLVGLRKVWNGGTNGLAEARKYLASAKKIFVGAGSSNASPIPLLSPAPATKESKLIENVQQLLRDKGYPEVGDVDNKMGRRTRNAITSFEADNGMPLTGQVSDELLAALVKAPARQNSAARTTATATDLKEKRIPTVTLADRIKKFGQGVLGVMGVGAVGQGVTDFDGIKTKLDSAKGLYDTVISFSPWIIGAVVGGGVIYGAVLIIQAQVEAYRAGHSV